MTIDDETIGTDTENDPMTEGTVGASPNVDLGLLADIHVSMTVEVGSTKITLQDLLRLNEGSVVELNRMAGDPLDIFVNGTAIAKGEVVIVGEQFGIRFGEIVDPARRFETI